MQRPFSSAGERAAPVALVSVSDGKGQVSKPPSEGDEHTTLEHTSSSPARFGQLSIFAVACFMSAMNWNILVRCGP
jgi:hypothetical protein